MFFSKELFGYTLEKSPVYLYHLENKAGAYIEVLDYGCRIRSICIPDKNNQLQDVCLGYSELSEYEKDVEYFGAAIGRCSNLIDNASFNLNQKVYHLDANNGTNHLHGGANGFSFLHWNCVQQDNKLIFKRFIPDLSDGYPGNLQMQITYEWTENNCLNIRYEGICDADTILNVTNHTYFNLNGNIIATPPENTVLNHELFIQSQSIVEINKSLLPTGKFLPVDKTPFDFRRFKTIGQDIENNHHQIIHGEGYDHCFVLDGHGFRKVAILQSPESGIRMTCYTDQPGIQIYTANGLTPCRGKYSETLFPRSGICLETQHFANTVHIPNFPSVVLPAEKPFISQTTYRFDILR